MIGILFFNKILYILINAMIKIFNKTSLLIKTIFSGEGGPS